MRAGEGFMRCSVLTYLAGASALLERGDIEISLFFGVRAHAVVSVFSEAVTNFWCEIFRHQLQLKNKKKIVNLKESPFTLSISP